ncbi:unnamed protein product [Staurois parvus]|uniref:Uncharacterized protein n=1 Tax=Staurois parvus TaxID=386267 RepID=A0ABN9D9Z3_9NEOB|nr:unnamed protein product [Staurois parvus]
MRCPWYLFHRLFEFGQGHRGPMILYCPGGPMSCQSAPAPFNFVQHAWSVELVSH